MPARKGFSPCPAPNHEGNGICGRPPYATAAGQMVCVRHYVQFRKHGELKPLKRRTEKGMVCLAVGLEALPCGRPARHWDDSVVPQVPLCKSHAEQRRLIRLGLREGELQPVRNRRVAQPSQLRDDEGNKRCIECSEWLPESEYWKSAPAQDGLFAACKHCSGMATRMHRFGLSKADFQRIIDTQGAACAICKSPFDRSRTISVDHDHACCAGNYSCGQCVRGFLCSSCNSGLGWMRDSIPGLHASVTYLTSWEQRRASTDRGSPKEP